MQKDVFFFRHWIQRKYCKVGYVQAHSSGVVPKKTPFVWLESPLFHVSVGCGISMDGPSLFSTVPETFITPWDPWWSMYSIIFPAFFYGQIFHKYRDSYGNLTNTVVLIYSNMVTREARKRQFPEARRGHWTCVCQKLPGWHRVAWGISHEENPTGPNSMAFSVAFSPIELGKDEPHIFLSCIF